MMIAKVKPTLNLNTRIGAPSTAAPKGNVLESGTEINVVSGPYKGLGETDSDLWYKTDTGYYVWGGGLDIISGTTAMLDLPEEDRIHYNPDKLPWHIKDYGIHEWWDKGITGRGVNVFVLDKGLPKSYNEWFKNIRLFSKSPVPNNQNDKYYSHGLQMAGLISASNIDQSYYGLAPNCNVTMVSVTDPLKGLLLEKALESILEGDRPDVISISQGVLNDSNFSALQKILIDASNRSIITISAGNPGDTLPSSNKLTYPAEYGIGIICSSVDASLNDKPEYPYTSKINFYGPGIGILVPTVSDQFITITSEEGSSHATAWMAGLCALLIEYHKKKSLSVSPENLKAFLNQLQKRNMNGKHVIDPSKLKDFLKNKL